MSAAQTYDRDWIAARIPHGGSMCLLDAVVAWDAQRIRCIATSHLAAGNPLRSRGRLASVCGIEYAAQAMAVHGALLADAGERPRVGMLASVRGAQTNLLREQHSRPASRGYHQPSRGRRTVERTAQSWPRST